VTELPVAGQSPPSRGAAFWLAAGLGILIMAFGARGILTHARGTEPSAFAVWLVGADLLHDLVVAPLVCLVAAGVARLLPDRVRAPIAAGLVTTAFVVLVGWAPLRGYGRATVPDNPTVQPLNYATGIATVLVVVWSVVLVWLLVSALRAAASQGRGEIASGRRRPGAARR
jgi:hypothetical protein